MRKGHGVKSVAFLSLSTTLKGIIPKNRHLSIVLSQKIQIYEEISIFEYMKKTITESDLRSIIKESVKKVLEGQEKQLLLEMPLHRKNYKERLTNELPQVIINWCLVHYCKIIGRTQLKEHWKDELRGHIFNMSSLSIKENDSVENRLIVLTEIWVEDDYDKPKSLTLKICNKFIKERINIDSEEFITTIQDCLNCKDNLFNVILSRDIEITRSYVDSI